MKFLETPLLFLVFNRPGLTKKVFEVIRDAAPKYLYIAADGPREHVAGESEICGEVRKIATAVDWDCEVKTLFREQNLGCGHAVSSAITWFFDDVEEGIILEDDCLPAPSFFHFCEEMLSRYRNDKNVMHISGDNFQSGKKRGTGDYYYSKYSHIWGWATWKRAWEKYDFDVEAWPRLRTEKLPAICYHDQNQIDFWTNVFNSVHERNVDTWDYQWLHAIWLNGGLCILPNYNLVINIGFGENATHTKEKKSELIVQITLDSICTFESPQQQKLIDKEADNFSFYNLFNPGAKKNTMLNRIYSKQKLRKLAGKKIRSIQSFFTTGFPTGNIKEN